MSIPLSINSLGSTCSSLFYNGNPDPDLGQVRCRLNVKPEATKDEQKQMLKLIKRQLSHIDNWRSLETQLTKLQTQWNAIQQRQGYSDAAERIQGQMNGAKQNIQAVTQAIESDREEFKREHGITLPSLIPIRNETLTEALPVLTEFRETLEKVIEIGEDQKVTGEDQKVTGEDQSVSDLTRRIQSRLTELVLTRSVVNSPNRFILF